MRISRTSTILLVLAVLSTGVAAQETSPLDTGYVVYEKGPITLPLGVGVRVPSYNRVDGLALPWGPDIKIAGSRVLVSPTVTYRSHIGELDPAMTGAIRIDSAIVLRFSGGRSTFSNDMWIRSDLMNSLAALFIGTDARNYFRADRATAELAYGVSRPAMTITPSIGALHEFAWSTGVPIRHTAAPWSALNETDSLRMRRTNPAIVRGHTTSGLGGLRIDYDDNVTTARFIARTEFAFDAPESPLSSDRFTQFTFDARAEFPTFGLQSFAFRGHGVATLKDAPPQRYAYLGGGGTLSTVDLLALGGDQLVFVEGEYRYPLRAPVLPFLGAPTLLARYAAGSAGAGDLPDFIQNLGMGISLKVIKVEYHIDPSYKESPFTHKNAFSVSVMMPF